MLSNRSSLLTAALLACSAIVTAVSMLRSADEGVDAAVLMFVAWAVSPYISFLAAGILLQKYVHSAHLQAATVVISVLMLLFTVLSYVSIPSDTSSTASLAYIFVPIYVYVGSFLLLSAALLISLFLGGSRKA